MMTLIEHAIKWYISRMSYEDKAALLDRSVTYFLAGMSPEEKQALIERAAAKLLDGVEMKNLLPSLLAMMWKRVGSDEERASILEKTVKLASLTSGKLTDTMASAFKRFW